MKELFVSCLTFIHRMSSTGNSNYFNFWGSLFLDQCCCRKFIEWITRKCCHRPSYTVFYAFFPNSPVFISSVFYLSWDSQRILHRFNWTTDETKKQYNKDTTKKKPGSLIMTSWLLFWMKQPRSGAAGEFHWLFPGVGAMARALTYLRGLCSI